MIKRLYTLILTGVIGIIAASAAIPGEWRQHPTFDNSVVRVIDTPERVYFMGYNQIVNPLVTFKSYPDMSLFYYDKEGDEMVAAAQRHSLCNTAVRLAEYNSKKGYLLIIYDDENIDMLYDSGEVRNIASLKHANIPGSKKVNSISFDPANNSAWLATDFGYIVINDDKHEVAESRNYGKAIKAVARVGNNVLMASDDEFFIAPAAAARLSITDYHVDPQFTNIIGIYPLGADRFLALGNPSNKRYNLLLTEIKGDALEIYNTGTLWSAISTTYAKDGLLLISDTNARYYTADERMPKNVVRPAEDHNIFSTASWDLMDFFTVVPRKGMRSNRRMADGTYVKTRDFMMPNAPTAYVSRGMVYHPEFGMLVNSHGQDGSLNSTQINEPILLSGLKNGLWTKYSPAYLNPDQALTGKTPRGLAIDPDNDKYVYMGSTFSGFTRLNLEDPQDILHYSFPGDATASLPGFVETYPGSQIFGRLCSFSEPIFDNNKTLWSSFADIDNANHLEFRYLTNEDRLASTDASTARPWKSIKASGMSTSNNCLFIPLKSSANKNMLFFLSLDGIMVYDHAGTLEDTSDDKKVVLNTFTDQDGGTVYLGDPGAVYEDPSGIVWIGNAEGLYYCQPRNMMQGQRVLNRVKVARNDGTSLADYLLNGIRVNCITSDPQGRKWFGTSNAGIVVTSSDGKTVHDEYTTDNSEIPCDIVYQMCYNPASNSMMVSTEKGLAEFFIGGTSTSDDRPDTIRAYPNPVAPDYYGWVTIDGLPDNASVKIVDAAGNLVRELGRVEAGSVQWDVNNLDNVRVKTGVYYILSSGGPDGSNESHATKILVMN